MDIGEIWSKTLKMLENSLSQVVFKSMIADMTPVSYKDGIFILRAKTEFFKTVINSKHIHEITVFIRSITSADTEVEVISPDDEKIGTSETNGNEAQKKADYERTGLRQRYNFDFFVPGKCNELAYVAARAVAETPGVAEGYNPLFLYGGVGLGKTHLMQSIGNYIFDANSDLKVLYVPSIIFTEEFISSLKEKTTHIFREKYRNLDVLLVDDVQFLAGKSETQEEMFHTFNTMLGKNKQIVFTSDMPPKELSELTDRLTSRFSSGLIADVSIPDYETRTAILEKKMALEKMELPSAVKEFIIRNIVSNIRDLEGALNKVMAYSRLTNAKLTIELAEKALKDQLKKAEHPSITPLFIRDTVARYFKFSSEDLCSRKKTQALVLARQTAMYLTRKIMDISLPDVGKFYNRDHSTVIYSCNKIADDLETDAKLRVIVEELEIRVRGE